MTGAWTTLKYDAAGNKLWSVSYGGPANFPASPAVVAVDSAGSVYVTGSMCVDAVFDWVSLMCVGSEYTTIKYDTNGNQLWVARYGGPVDEAGASAIVLDAAGNVHVTGSSMGVDYSYRLCDDQVQTQTGISSGSPATMVRRMMDDIATAIALDAAGNSVYVTGDKRTALVRLIMRRSSMTETGTNSGSPGTTVREMVTIGPQPSSSMPPGMCM